MCGRRILASILVVALGGISIGVATAWYSDSGAIEYQISAASDFGDHTEEKVWVCKLVGPPDTPRVKPGKNPIHVSVKHADAEEGFSDAHPSYVVESGDVECVVPDETGEPVTGAEERVGSSEAGTTTTSSTSSSTTSTSTTTSTTTSTSTTSTTSTTTSTTSTTISTTTTTMSPPED